MITIFANRAEVADFLSFVTGKSLDDVKIILDVTFATLDADKNSKISQEGMRVYQYLYFEEY